MTVPEFARTLGVTIWDVKQAELSDSWGTKAHPNIRAAFNRLWNQLNTPTDITLPHVSNGKLQLMLLKDILKLGLENDSFSYIRPLIENQIKVLEARNGS